MDIDQTQVVVVDDLEDDLIFSGERKLAASLRMLPQKDLDGTNFPLYEGDNVVGRNGDTCHVTIPSKSLSKEHACIQIIADSHLIFDKGSRNKTRRGKLVLRPDVRYELKHGDEISFADIKFVYEIHEQSHSGRDGADHEVQSTLVLSDSDDDDDVQLSQGRVVTETVVVEVSDEDSSSSEDLMGVPTQEFGGAGGREQHGKPGKSSEARPTAGESSHQPPRQQDGTKSFEVAGNSDVRETTSLHQKFASSVFTPRQIVDEDGDEDAAELFAVSTLAYDVSADVVDIDNDDIDERLTCDVEVVTNLDGSAGSETVAVHLDAAVAVTGHGKLVYKKAPACSSARSLTQPLAETLPAEGVVTSSGTENNGIQKNNDVCTQIIDSTVVLDKDDLKKVSRMMRNTRGRKAISDHTNSAIVITDDTLPTSSTPPTRGKHNRDLQLQEKNRQASYNTSREPTLALRSFGEISDKSQSIEKTSSRSKRLRQDDSVRNNELGQKSGLIILDSTQIFCPGNSDNTQPQEEDGSPNTLTVGMDTQQQEVDGSPNTLTVGLDTQQTHQNMGVTQDVDRSGETDNCSQGGTASLKTSSPQAYLNSSDDSDLEEHSVLRPHLDEPSQSNADLTVDKEQLTLAYDLEVDREPTLAYDLEVDREPTLAYNLEVDREPTLAYDLEVDREPTLAYNLTVEEKPGKTVQKYRLLKTRRHTRIKADPGPDTSMSVVPDTSMSVVPDTSMSVAPLPTKSPLKSALLDRRRSPSPAYRHVAFAEEVDKEEDKQAQESRNVKTVGYLPSQVSDNITGSSVRLRRLRNQKVLPQPALAIHKNGATSWGEDGSGAGPSTESRKRHRVSGLTDVDGGSLGVQKKLQVDDQGAVSRQLSRAGIRDRVVCLTRDDAFLTPGQACNTKETPSPACQAKETPSPACHAKETPSPACHAKETPSPACHAKETRAHKIGIKRKKTGMKDQQEQGGDGESLQPTSKQGRMSVVASVQEVVAKTQSRRAHTGRRRQVPEQQHTSTGKKQTRRCADLLIEKKETDIDESGGTTSITSAMSDSGTKINVKQNSKSITEVAFNRRTAREMRENISKEDTEKGTNGSTSIIPFMRSRRRVISKNLPENVKGTSRRISQQEGSPSTECKKQALTGSTHQYQESESISKLLDPAKDMTKGASESAVAKPDRSLKQVASSVRQATKIGGRDSHIGKSDSYGERVVCETTSSGVMPTGRVTSSGVIPPDRVTRMGVRKSQPSEESDSQSRLKDEVSHIIEPISTARGRKRKTSTNVTSSGERNISEGNQVSDGHKPDQRSKKAPSKLSSSAVLTGVLNLQSCQNGVFSSSHTSTTPAAGSPRCQGKRKEVPDVRAGGRKSQVTERVLTDTDIRVGGRKSQVTEKVLTDVRAGGRKSQVTERVLTDTDIRAGGGKFQVTERVLTDTDSEKTGNSKSSAQLPARRKMTETTTSKDNVVLGTNSPGKSIKQLPSPTKKSKKTFSPQPPAQTDKTVSAALGKFSKIFTPKVMLTGYVDKQADKVVMNLGGEMANSIEECTHLITDRICRTVKLLSGLAKGLLIVSPQWLTSCKQAGTFLDGHMFLVVDSAMEEQYKFDLATSIRKAQDSPMLAGYRVHVTESVRPDPAQMKDILTFSGAECLETMPKKTQDNTVVISCVKDHDLCHPAINAGIPVVGAEFVLTGILRQELDFESYSLFRDDDSSSQTAGKRRTRKK